MRKLITCFALSVLCFTQVSFADSNNASNKSASCKKIASLCVKAGYTRHGDWDQSFWGKCMKPVLLGQTVKKVKVDVAAANDCRQQKITEMQSELQEFQNATPAKSQ